MRPWHVEHPTPADKCALWSKYTKSGSRWMWTQGMGVFVAKLSRTGRSFALSGRTLVWQFMHTWVDGMAAKLERSTVEWQYRQSIPKSPAWSLWL